MEQLRNFEVSLLPHMKEYDRQQTYLRYQQLVVPAEVDEKVIEDSWNFLRKSGGRGTLQ